MKRVIIFLAITVFAMMVWSIVTHPPAPLENTDVSGQVIPVPTSVPAANPNLSRALDSADKVTAIANNAVNTIKVITVVVVAAIVLIVIIIAVVASRMRAQFAQVSDLNGGTVLALTDVRGDKSEPQAIPAMVKIQDQIHKRETERFLPKPDILDV